MAALFRRSAGTFKQISSACCSELRACSAVQLACISSEASSSGRRTASFGYQEVDEQEKKTLVGQVFSSVASKYDIMNDLMSGGLHRLWKDRLVDTLRPFSGMRHLDVAGGTGDVAFRVLDAIRVAEAQVQLASAAFATMPGAVVVCDINPNMLEEGRRKAEAKGYGPGSLEWVEGDAEKLPFADESMDGYTVAFGIRNVTHIDAALREAFRVLKRGGRFLCLEFSEVTVPLLREAYDMYSLNVIPQIGRVVADDAASYQYLVESIRRFPKQEVFAAMVREAGFRNVTYKNLTAGVVAIHSGFKL